MKDNILIVGFIIDDSSDFIDIKKEMIEKSTIIADTVDVFQFNYKYKDREYLSRLLKDTCLFRVVGVRVVDTVSFESFEVYFDSNSEDTLTDLGLDYNIKKGCYGFKYYSSKSNAYNMYILHRTYDKEWSKLFYRDICVFENLKGSIKFVTSDNFTGNGLYHQLENSDNLDYIIVELKIERYRGIEHLLSLNYIYKLGFTLETHGIGIIIWTNIEKDSIFCIGKSYCKLEIKISCVYLKAKVSICSLLTTDSCFCIVGKYCFLVESNCSVIIVPLHCEYVYFRDLRNLSFENIVVHSNVKCLMPVYSDLDACKGRTLYLSKLCDFRILADHLMRDEFNKYIRKKTEEVYGKCTSELKEIEIKKFYSEFNTIEIAVKELSKHYDFGISIQFY